MRPKDKEAAKDDAANPLVKDGHKLIPSVTRVFSTDRELYVYLQAYEVGSTGGTTATAANSASVKSAAPLIAFVSFYREQKKMFETAPIAVDTATGQPVRGDADQLQYQSR